MVLQTSANNDQLKALERQLVDYKDPLDKFMTHGAPKPASKRAPKVAAAKKTHEVGTLDLPARQALTKSLRPPKEGEAVFAIKPAVTKDSYLYVRGTVDSVEGVFVYMSISPDIRIVGCSVLGRGAERLVRTQFPEHPPSLNFGANHLKKWIQHPQKPPIPLLSPHNPHHRGGFFLGGGSKSLSTVRTQLEHN